MRPVRFVMPWAMAACALVIVASLALRAEASTPSRVFIGARAILVDALIQVGSNSLEGQSADGLRAAALRTIGGMLPDDLRAMARGYDPHARTDWREVRVSVKVSFMPVPNSSSMLFVGTLTLYRDAAQGEPVVRSETTPAVAFLEGSVAEVQTQIDAALGTLLRRDVVGPLLHALGRRGSPAAVMQR